MPSFTDQEKFPQRATGPELGVGESLLAGEATGSAGILEQVPDDLRGKLPDELVDELLAGARTEEQIVGPGGLLSKLTKRLVERAMEVELTDHLGYQPHQEPPGGAGNTRNGSTPKTLSTEHGQVEIKTPRDRRGTFEPKIVSDLKGSVHHLGWLKVLTGSGVVLGSDRGCGAEAVGRGGAAVVVRARSPRGQSLQEGGG